MTQVRKVLACIGVGVVVVVGGACSDENPTTTLALTPTIGGTQLPSGASTLRANTLATAESLPTQTQSIVSATDEPSPTLSRDTAMGLPPAALVGPCPVPDGFRLYTRQGFCVAAPVDWTAYNVDSSGTAPLNTTPGQAISFRPSRAASIAECHLTIFIANEESADAHIGHYHAAFAARGNVVAISSMGMQSLAGMMLPGFTWVGPNGTIGGVFAGILGERRIVHISYGGNVCFQDDLESVLETLRFE